MKKILLITAILLSVITTAQDANFITSLNKTTISAAQELSDSIVSVSGMEYKLLKSTLKSDRQRFIYIPITIAEDDFKKKRSYEKALVIDFSVYENEPGIKTLKLHRIQAPYNSAFSVWKNYFRSDAGINTISTDYSLQKLKIDNLEFRFNKEMGYDTPVWSIRNNS